MAACTVCQEPLTVYIEKEEHEHVDQNSSANDGSCVDDDVQMQCGCHFHWQCLLETFSLNQCPNCGSDLITSTRSGEQQLLSNVKNEGGLQERLDILPILTEESYLRAYPEERRSRAFLEFCGEGDVEAIVDLLNDDEDEDEDDLEDTEKDRGTEHKTNVLWYQDQLGSMGTALHVAVKNQRLEVVWLLLFLASSLDIAAFPSEVLQAAQNFNLERREQGTMPDIRSLRDLEGKTAEQRAAELGGPWDEWVSSGRLKPE